MNLLYKDFKTMNLLHSTLLLLNLLYSLILDVAHVIIMIKKIGEYVCVKTKFIEFCPYHLNSLGPKKKEKNEGPLDY